MNKDELKKQVISAVKNRINMYANNNIKASKAEVNNQMGLCKKMLNNIEEVISIIAAKKSAHLLYLYASNQMNIAYDKAYIQKGDKIDTLLNNLNISKTRLLNSKDNKLWDDCVQKIFKELGFKTILPKHSDINNLERNIEKLRETSGEKIKIINLEEQLNLKKSALGELPYQWSGGLPIHLSSDVRRIANQERRIVYAPLEASLNNQPKVRR